MNAIDPLTGAADRIADLQRTVERFIEDFRRRLDEGRENRRIPRENIDTMQQAGLYRVYNPARFGGFEMHMRDVLPIVTRIAEYCPASGWVLAVYQIHTWVISLFPERAQQEVFPANPDAIVCASLNPSKNTTRKVDGGYLIENGRFTFCSGVHYRDWTLLGSLITGDGGDIIDAGCLLVPGNEVEELDDWYVSGLQATGSISLIAEDLFIPEHRFLSYTDATEYKTAGGQQNSGSLYSAAFVPMLVLNLAGPALGAAEQALRCSVARLNELGDKAGSYPLVGVARTDAPAAHEVISTARMQIDSARLLLDQAGRSIREFAEAGKPMEPQDSAKVNLDTSYSVRECLKAAQLIFLQGGGAVLQPTHPLQQAYQDVSAVNCHGFLAHEANLALYGSLITGHDHPQAFL